MDADTMRSPGSHEQALEKFRRGEARILLGTQMIAKGLDFPNVTLVGVVNADTALHLPEFRAGERTFQLVTQVAGRTGRGEKGGRVLVQTYSPDHPAIEAAVRHNYEMFARAELPVREAFSYPPFTHAVRLVFRGAAEAATETLACAMGQQIRDTLQQRGVASHISGPAPAPIAKLRGKFRYHMLIRSAQQEALCHAIREVTSQFAANNEVQWIVDVDAISML